MTTLTVMKARIADELARDDLTTSIASAISSAIQLYQDKRFYFNEKRTITFPTVASQEFYTSADNSDIPNIIQIDYATILIGTTDVRKLNYRSESDLEDLSNNATTTGDPYSYGYYNQQIRLYPVPNAVRTVRFAGHYKYAEPASDGEASNFWMTDAEILIRSRAKYELALHVLYDNEMAQTMAAASQDALDHLKSRTARQTGTGQVVPMRF